MSTKIDRGVSYRQAVEFLSSVDRAAGAKNAGNIGYLDGKVVTRCKNPDGCSAMKEKLLTALKTVAEFRHVQVADDVFSRKADEMLSREGKPLGERTLVRAYLQDVRESVFDGKTITSTDAEFGFGVDEFTFDDIQEAREAALKERIAGYGDIPPQEKKMRLLADKITDGILQEKFYWKKKDEFDAACEECEKKNMKKPESRLFLLPHSNISSDEFKATLKKFGTTRAEISKNVLAALQKEMKERPGDDDAAIKRRTILNRNFTSRIKEGTAEQVKEFVNQNFTKSLQVGIKMSRGFDANLKGGIYPDFFRGCNGANMLKNSFLNDKPLLDLFSKRMTDEFVQTDMYREKFSEEVTAPGGSVLLDKDGSYIGRIEKLHIAESESGRIAEELMKSFPENSKDCSGMMFFVTMMLSLSHTASFESMEGFDPAWDKGFGGFTDNVTKGIVYIPGGAKNIETDIRIDGDKVRIVQKFNIGAELSELDGVKIPVTLINNMAHTVTIEFPITENIGLKSGEMPKGMTVDVQLKCDDDYVRQDAAA